MLKIFYVEKKFVMKFFFPLVNHLARGLKCNFQIEKKIVKNTPPNFPHLFFSPLQTRPQNSKDILEQQKYYKRNKNLIFVASLWRRAIVDEKNGSGKIVESSTCMWKKSLKNKLPTFECKFFFFSHERFMVKKKKLKCIFCCIRGVLCGILR